MQKRKLGNSGIEIAPLMFGGNVFGWTANEQTSFRLLDAFVDAGFNAIDTADVYSTWAPGHTGGESETIIGRWFAKTGKRNKVMLATKVGNKMSEDKRGLAKKYILQAVEDSLKRLNIDTIDLYQSHIDDESTPLDETLEAYALLIKQGKVRVIGASNYKKDRLENAEKLSEQLGIPLYETFQPRYNLYDRKDYEQELAPFCQKQNISVISYSFLCSGFLTGKYRAESDASKSPRGAGIITKYFNERGFSILDALDSVAKQLSSTPGNVAIAWLLTRPLVTPIASATSIEQLNDLLAATRLQLNQTQIDLLNQASA
jgi:aryl-alcohol dehydrogenase-like predicted oxidoreductase